jgi:hypothetical protein
MEPPRNQALASNMRRLMAGRSIATIRDQMAQKGLAIGTGTLHRAYLGQVGNRLESLEKIAEFFETTVDQLLQFDGVDSAYWPFSEELQQKVLLLSDEGLYQLETVMRAHLGMAQKPVTPITSYRQMDTDKRPTVEHHARTEEGAPLPQDIDLLAPKHDGRSKKIQRPPQHKGRRGT